MTEPNTAVDAYLSAYGESDADRRAELIEQAWAIDGRLIDPPLTAQGRDEISGAAAALQEQFAGHRFRRVSAIDLHHDRARYAWELVAPDGSVALSGLDVAELDEDGRLRSVIGFFGELPAADTSAALA